MIFYFGYHTGKTGDSPDYQKEHREEFNIDIKQSGKLLRAVTEIARNLVEGQWQYHENVEPVQMIFSKD